MAADFFFGIEGLTLTPEGSRILREFQSLTKKKVGLGFNGAAYPDGTPVIEVAMMQEQGTSTIPPRPFMQRAVERNRDRIVGAMEKSVDRVLSGTGAENALQDVTKVLEDSVRSELRSGNFTPNSPATVKRKGSSTPLHDTGLMERSVKAKITD